MTLATEPGVQAPARPTLAGCAGLTFFRMPSYRFADRQRPGVILTQMREGDEPPPYLAEAWKPAGGKWSYDFGGKWVPVDQRKIRWEWN